MKKVNRAVITIILCTVTASYANAGDRAIAGLAIGGGTGAVIGQAVGHNIESTLLGATVGGAIGLIIGNELGRNHVIVHNRYYPPPRHHYRSKVHHPRYKHGYIKSKHRYAPGWDRSRYAPRWDRPRYAPHRKPWPNHKVYRDRRHH